MSNFSELRGKVLKSITVNKNKDEMCFVTVDGDTYKMNHQQDCCESVNIEDICGDLEDLIGSEILVAEEVTESGDSDYGTCTWTFYKLDTVKGGVTIRWYGESNGYYSESVDFYKE